jgi:hypothetical protein
MDILIPELQSIREIDKSFAKFSIREMIDTNTFETQQMLTLVAPEPEAIIEQEIEVTQEEKTQNFDIQNQEQTKYFATIHSKFSKPCSGISNSNFFNKKEFSYC